VLVKNIFITNFLKIEYVKNMLVKIEYAKNMLVKIKYVKNTIPPNHIHPPQPPFSAK
jgi:hypothetical protein